MNPFFSAIIYAALHKRVTCGHCGAFDHHERTGTARYRCKKCGKEFTVQER